MIVKILEVKSGAALYEGSPMEYWVKVQLESRDKIWIGDLDPLDVREYEGKYLDCLINAWVDDIDNDSKFIIKGMYIEYYDIPSRWEGIFDPIEHYSAVVTEYGTFLLDPVIIEFENKHGQIIEFEGYRLDLTAFLPIEQKNLDDFRIKKENLMEKVTYFFNLDAILDEKEWIVEQCDLIFEEYQENEELLTRERLLRYLQRYLNNFKKYDIVFTSILTIFLMEKEIPIPKILAYHLVKLIDEELKIERKEWMSERIERYYTTFSRFKEILYENIE